MPLERNEQQCDLSNKGGGLHPYSIELDTENFKLNSKGYSRNTKKIQEYVLFMEEMEGIEGKPVFTDERISAEGKPLQ
jgi:hypothetical protein